MAKYAFSTAIPYGTDIFEVTGVEYCEWEDAVESCNGDTTAMEWATYDFLMNNGYLVAEPSVERPKKKGEANGTTKTTGKNKKAVTLGDVKSPGIRGLPDGFTLIEGSTREPTWTQSRILLERDRLLKEREKIQDKKEKALQQKILEQQLIEQYTHKSKPRTDIGEGIWILIGVFLFLCFLVTVFKVG